MNFASLKPGVAVRLRMAFLGFVLLGVTAASQAGTPYPRPGTPAPQDVGALDLVRGAAPITVTVALKPGNASELEALATAIHTVGSPNFHQFLTPDEFHARFAPSPATVSAAIAHFVQAGLTAVLDSGNLLRVTGSPQAIEQAFNVKLHLFDVAASNGRPGFRFRAPLGQPTLASAAVAANVDAIIGLDDRPHFRPHLRKAAAALRAAHPLAAARPANATGNDPGNWTVTDLAQYYDIQPLYDQGFHGEGRTMAIVTLASFTPSDAFGYWGSLGLSVHANRLKVVDIDGGPGAPSDDSGSVETTLDVEQSGGLAPAAKIIVYQAPNTDQAFYDAFARAINDNSAETVSVSWGEWELLDAQADVNVGRARRGAQLLQAFSNLFLQAAVQGQSFFAASGDDGAYDANDSAAQFPLPDFSKTLSVDSPGVSPWLTSAGGTTLAGDQVLLLPDGSIFTVDVPSERVWGWDYLDGFCAKLGLDPVSCGIFPAGSGGGVSSFVPMPFYQGFVSGIRTTEPGQSLVDNTTTPPTTLFTLPAHYPGRNVPDVSLNADPDTGYIIAYTSDQIGFVVFNFFGGTSFVAPQLNGIAALLGQRVQGRLGLLNVPLYLAAASPLGYVGPEAPLHDIKSGDNGFYNGHAGYDQGSGVGTLDVANFARTLLLLGY
jgi:kumamolisin